MNNIIIQYQCRLGNQMFQYALQRSFELKGYSTRAYIGSYDNTFNQETFQLPLVFKNIQLDFVKKEGLKSSIKIHEPLGHSSTFMPSVYELNNDCDYTLDGYFQTEKYFDDIREDLLKQFEFTINDDKLTEAAESIRNSNKPVVSLHIRRSDYMHSCEHKGICTKQYYENAISTMKELLDTDDIRVIVFSDDIEWCKEHYPDYEYIGIKQFNNYEDWYDMYLMSCCDHNIIANSTFSWWGAWLNQNTNKIVIAPDKWLNNSDTPDIWCDDWTKVSVT